MKDSKLSKGPLILKMLVRLILGIGGIMALLFLPAGTFNFWQAWVLLGILIALMLPVAFYLIKKDPEMLARRLKTNEQNKSQRWIILLFTVLLTAEFILPGFDKRWGWSKVSVVIIIAADLLAMGAYLLYSLVIRENRFASRVIEVEQKQKVISSGPYAVIRHPMYASMMLMFLMIPLALGSYWALIPAVLSIPLFAARILNEEQLLVRELPGYEEYKHKVKYRLIPGIW